jgi:arylsulfatase A-like enzyme
MYEETRMPLIVRYPRSIEAGSESKALCMNIDFAPTFLDYAGVEIPKDMQGRSLRPVIDNAGKVPADWRKNTYYHYYEYPAEHSVKRQYGIRTDRYKLIHFYNDIDEWELYDLDEDPDEMNNVYENSSYGEVRTMMHNLLEKSQEEYGDNDPEEKEKVLFKGDRRVMDRVKTH